MGRFDRSNSFDKKIKDPKVALALEAVKEAYKQEGEVLEATIGKMKELRQLYIEHKQPTIVKSLRLVYEYAEKFEDFNIDYWEAEESDLSAFEYYLDLLSNPNNKYNREEIKELNILLKHAIDGTTPPPPEDEEVAEEDAGEE